MSVDCSSENCVKAAFEDIKKNHTINHLVLSSGGKGPSGSFLEQDQAGLMEVWN